MPETCGFDPWVGKIPGGANGNSLQYSYLKNPTDRVAWWATIQRITSELDMTKHKHSMVANSFYYVYFNTTSF